ncbi:MAG: RHS repeat protein [Alphaproteobacteria bacterium]|nr:RHS repeat protein [Alphaproteobacteria bacterium]
MKPASFLLGLFLVSIGAAPLSAATTYTYDDLGRLSKVCYDNGKQIAYSYDAAGNRTQVVTQGTCS